MICFTSHTALEFWTWLARTGSNLERPRRARSSLESWPTALRHDDIVAACASFHDADEPIHVLVPQRANHRRSCDVIYHRTNHDLPFGSLFRLNQHLLVVSPEFAFMQMSSELTRIEAAKLATELCSSFTYCDVDPRGFVKCEPITTSRKLMNFITRAEGLRGVAGARKAASLSLDGAASPREAAAALLLTMPMKLGGYGLPKPLMNERILLSASQQKMHRRPYITADMTWKQGRVVLEYDSDAFHTSRPEIATDSRRRKVFEDLGFLVLTLTNDELKSEQDMWNIASQIAKRSRRRLRVTIKDFSKKHRELRRTLFLPRKQLAVVIEDEKW